MNYELFEDSDSIDPIFVASFERPAEFRPHVGDLVSLPTDLRVFRVNRSEPTDNPSDQKVIYFVREHRDNRNVQSDFIVENSLS